METKTIIITGWHHGLQTVALIKLLHEYGYGLARAKAAVDQLLEGHDIVLHVEDYIGEYKLSKQIEELEKTGAAVAIR